MGSTDRYVGQNQVLKLNGTEITGLKEVTLTKTISTVDSTAGSEGAISRIAVHRDVTGSLRYVSEGTAGDQSHIATLEPTGVLVTFEYGPEGTLAGTHMKEAGSVIITSHEISGQYDSLTERTANFEASGTWVADSETDTW